MVLFDLLVVVLALLLIIVLVARRMDINIALLAGSGIILAYFAGFNLLSIVIRAITDTRTLFLLAMSASISLLAELYRKTELITEFGKGVAKALRNPIIAIALTPTIIGLLPVAGGALMSAPIVEGIGVYIGLSRDLMAFLNVWFRHILFMIYPLSQVLIAISAVTGYGISSIIALQTPVALFMAIIGYIIGLRNHVKSKTYTLTTRKSLWRSGLPLLTAIVSSITLMTTLSEEYMPLGVLIGVLVLYFTTGKPRDKLVESILSRNVQSITLSALSIMILQHSIIDTKAAETLGLVVSTRYLPRLVIEAIIPGVISGLSSSPLTGVIITLPILASMGDLTIMDVSMTYISSYLAYVVSPTHLCLVFTAKYFNEELTRIYRYMLPATIATIVFTVVYYSLLLSW